MIEPWYLAIREAVEYHVVLLEIIHFPILSQRAMTSLIASYLTNSDSEKPIAGAKSHVHNQGG